MPLISATTWVRKGAAKELPETFQLDEQTYQEILGRAQSEIAEAKAGLAKAKADAGSIEDDMAKFNLQDYDDGSITTVEEDAIDFFSNPSHLAEEGDADGKEEDPLDEEDLEDLRINPALDSLVLAARTEDSVSYLEVYVYEEDEDNLYVHHDLMLPTFPLCLEWIGHKKDSSELGNFCAVGTFDPEIEIWDLNVLEAAIPTITLGGADKKKKRKKSGSGHLDAVMCLSWNRLHGAMLASGSADRTVKLWDLDHPAAPLHTLTGHGDKVQAVRWNPMHGSLLLTASYDKTVSLLDCRQPQSDVGLKLSIGDSADPEALDWNPHNPDQFALSDESGLVRIYDVRSAPTSLLSLQAHGKATTAINWNPAIPGCLLTASADKSLKVWKIDAASLVHPVLSREPGVGKLFSASFCPDRPTLVSTAGSRGELRVYNLARDSEAFVEAFQSNNH